MKLRKFMIATVALGALVLSGCAGGAAEDTGPSVEVKDVTFEAGTTMARINEAGTVKVGTKFDLPLFGLMGPSGVPEGFDVEIGKMIAAELGIEPSKIEWVEMVTANSEPFIQNGQVDYTVSVYTINDKRKEVVDFAGPYFVAGQDLLVLAGNPEGIAGLDDVLDKKVCATTGSTPGANLKAAGVEVIETDAVSSCLEPLRAGEVAAMSTDNAILAGLAAQNEGEFEVIDNPFTEEPYGVGLKKGDTAFRNFINDVIEEAIADGRWEAAWKQTAGTILAVPEAPKVDRY